MNSLYKQLRGNNMWNHILYPTLLIAIEILDKEGAGVNIVFCPPSICMPNLEKPKNIIFSPWGHKNINNGVAQPIRTLKRSKYIF